MVEHRIVDPRVGGSIPLAHPRNVRLEDDSKVASFFGVTLPDGVEARLRAGAPVLPLEGLSAASGCEAGRAVKLLDQHGALVACGMSRIPRTESSRS